MYKVGHYPIPDVKTGRPVKKYPFEDLDVGMSFFVPEGTESKLRSLRARCSQESVNGQRYRCSKLPSGEIQVWREA